MSIGSYMYIHICGDIAVSSRSIIGVFDLDKSTISKTTREFLAAAQKRGSIVDLSTDIPKSFVVTEKNGVTTVYIAQVSADTIWKRIKNAVP